MFEIEGMVWRNVKGMWANSHYPPHHFQVSPVAISLCSELLKASVTTVSIRVRHSSGRIIMIYRSLKIGVVSVIPMSSDEVCNLESGSPVVFDGVLGLFYTKLGVSSSFLWSFWGCHL